MRLIEYGKQLPKKADKAKLVYEKECGEPSRRGSVITLPFHTSTELFCLLEDFKQFLLRFHTQVWFGGTDENPFLVRMDDNSINTYLQGGPVAFYESLIPAKLTKLCQIVGKPFVRQGDIFAVPMNFGWKELNNAFKLFNGEELNIAEAKQRSVFGTRHVLDGLALESPMHVLGLSSVALAEGRIAAPDHSPKELTGPHALEQTAGLFNPQEAD